MNQTSAPQTETGVITSIYRYPVKGLTPERLDQVDVETGGTLPWDRAYAIENGPGKFDPDAPAFVPKIQFLMLMRNERLANLSTSFDGATQTLTISRDGRQVVRGALNTRTGCQMIEQFMAAYMKDELRGAPRVVSAPGHSFSDCGENLVHIVNLASLRELERVMGKPVDPLRFRANVYVDNWPAWAEFDMLEQPVTAGSATLRITRRTVRCDATNVDPSTGIRDSAIPRQLERHFGHSDFGVYAQVEAGGQLKTGDHMIAG
jgi:uncharacterized protein